MSESAKESFDRMLKVCERPTSRVRFWFGGEYWEEASGPEFLKRLRGNKSGKVLINWVTDVRKSFD